MERHSPRTKNSDFSDPKNDIGNTEREEGSESLWLSDFHEFMEEYAEAEVVDREYSNFMRETVVGEYFPWGTLRYVDRAVGSSVSSIVSAASEAPRPASVCWK